MYLWNRSSTYPSSCTEPPSLRSKLLSSYNISASSPSTATLTAFSGRSSLSWHGASHPCLWRSSPATQLLAFGTNLFQPTVCLSTHGGRSNTQTMSSLILPSSAFLSRRSGSSASPGARSSLCSASSPLVSCKQQLPPLSQLT